MDSLDAPVDHPFDLYDHDLEDLMRAHLNLLACNHNYREAIAWRRRAMSRMIEVHGENGAQVGEHLNIHAASVYRSLHPRPKAPKRGGVR